MDLSCRIISLENAAEFPFFAAPYQKPCSKYILALEDP